MEFVAGGDFFTLLSREGSVSEQQARLFMAEILLAISHLHKLGIVYRDLKPENVLLGDDGHVRLTDFGLSRCVNRGVAVPAVVYTFASSRRVFCVFSPQRLSRTVK